MAAITLVDTTKLTAAVETTARVEKLAANVSVPVANPYQKEYVITQLQFEAMSSDEFCLPENAAKIREKILQVINSEAPISKNLLCKRVLQSCGIGRMGARIERHFAELFRQLTLSTTTCGGNSFFWKDGIHPERLSVYRVSADEADRRNAEDLPPEETAYAVRSVLNNQIGLPRGELIRETARTLGYQRMGKAVESAMNLAIELAIKRGWAAGDASGNVVLA